MNDTENFEFVVGKALDATIRHKKEWATATPRSLNYACMLSSLALYLDSSADVLGAFSGVPNMAYPYKFPQDMTRESFVMREIYKPVVQQSIGLEWHVASSLMTRVPAELRDAGADAYTRISERCATPLLKPILDVAALNPDAKIEEIDFNRSSYAEVYTVLVGIGSLFHPGDIQHFIRLTRHDGFDAQDISSVHPLADLIFSWAHDRFGFEQRYSPCPTSIQKLDREFRRRGVPHDTTSILEDLENSAVDNLVKAGPTVLARMYLASWTWQHGHTRSREILISLNKGNGLVNVPTVKKALYLAGIENLVDSNPIAEIQSVGRKHEAFERKLISAVRFGGCESEVTREMSKIADSLQEAGTPKAVSSMIKKRWTAFLRKAAA